MSARDVHAPPLLVEYRLRRVGVGAGAPHWVQPSCVIVLQVHAMNEVMAQRSAALAPTPTRRRRYSTRRGGA